LANRELFRQRLERSAITTGVTRINSVLYLDFDDFKRINDTLGHQTGDAFLVAMGERLVAVVRPEDTVARLGGDEFAVLLEGADTRAGVAAAERVLESLKALGLHLAIDDFGTGYSALSRLRSLPFDTLKVDKVFVDELDAVNPGSTLAESILDMARVLRLRVIAEGVETAAQADYLRRRGCDSAQGYCSAVRLRPKHLPRCCSSGPRCRWSGRRQRSRSSLPTPAVAVPSVQARGRGWVQSMRWPFFSL
jgi:predicted signal transduction protein with EAL and GGDEF domain